LEYIFIERVILEFFKYDRVHVKSDDGVQKVFASHELGCNSFGAAIMTQSSKTNYVSPNAGVNPI